MDLRNYGLRNTWLEKCLKKSVSEYRSIVNILNTPKHCWNLHDSTFIRFFYHSEGNGVRKSLT